MLSKEIKFVPKNRIANPDYFVDDMKSHQRVKISLQDLFQKPVYLISTGKYLRRKAICMKMINAYWRVQSVKVEDFFDQA